LEGQKVPTQAEQQVKQADAELREKKSFEDLLPEVTQKCTLAEEYMEKVGPVGPSGSQ